MVGSLVRIARFLGWREFVVAFFTIALAATAPNIFVGISSVIHSIPELSFGEVLGGNVVDLTIAVALAVLVAKGLPAKSRMVQTSSIFTMVVAILPLLLILDGVLGRGDGIILILCFFFYVLWLFSKKERFTKKYNEDEMVVVKGFKVFIKDLGKIIFGVALLLLAAEGIVRSSIFFAEKLNLSLVLIGLLIVGLGNALPETYFAVISARKKQTWMILGNLMGSIIMASTLGLGTVALLSPIRVIEFSQFAVARFFLIVSAIFFFLFVRSNKKISKKEAFALLVIYFLFILAEILLR